MKSARSWRPVSVSPPGSMSIRSAGSPFVEPERRFHDITTPCEWVEDYRPGGYHPVHIGDTFKDGQYRIVRKLGEGSFSTVWLARDLRNQNYAVIKILVSEVSSPLQEVQILRHIASDESTESSRYVMQLLDQFRHHGPNGVHECLVFEPMGPNVNVMVEELPQFKPRMWGMEVRYPFWMAKSILKQSLQGLKYLHARGIAHGDFQPGNMLFCLGGIDAQTEDALRQREEVGEDIESESISPPVQRLDGQPDPSAPRYLCVAKPLVDPTSQRDGFKIKLSDMGGAYLFATPPEKVLTPRGLRPPEFVLAGDIDKSLDIWSFGCLVFELITGQPLFCVPYSEFEDDDHLLQFEERLGPLPQELFKQWQNSYMYYTPERVLYNRQIGGVPEGGEPLVVQQGPMEDYFDEAKVGLAEDDTRMVKALIRRILQYDPKARPSPEELLDDPFFA